MTTLNRYSFCKRFYNHAGIIFVGIFFLLFGLHDLAIGQSNTYVDDDSLLGQILSNQHESNKNLMSITFMNVNLEEALEILAERLRVGFSYNPDILPEKRINFRMTNVPAHEIIYKLLEGTNLEPVLPTSKDVIILKEKGAVLDFDIIQDVVRGTVVDATTGESLPGVNILVQGTTDVGTTTDNNGEFQLNVPSLEATLIITYIGYERLVVEISGRTELNIELMSDILMLEDIVVIGYGEQRRRDLTGSITSVNAAQFEGERISSIDQGLQGKAAGVNVTSGSGRPGGSMIVRIRGNSSVLGSNDPLYVIDGIPIQTGTSGGTSMLAMLDPGDVQSIDILKDASATAIYGSRGSNGVIIITTKQGQRGTNIIDFQMTTGFQQVDNKLDMMNSRQFIEIANERAVNDGGVPLFTNIESLASVNTDWQDEVFRTAPTQNYTLSFSGGDETTRYAVTGNYYDEEGIVRSTDFMRGSLRVNIDQEINSRLNVTTRSFVSRSITNAIPEQLIIQSMLQAPPFLTVYDDDGNYTPAPVLKGFPFSASTGENPVALADEQLNRRVMDRIIGNVSANYQLLENLSFRMLLGVDHHSAEQDNYNPRILDIGLPAGSGSKGLSKSTSFINENTLNYQNTLRENDRIDITAGVTWQQDQNTFLSGSASVFVTDDLQNNVLSSGENFAAPSNGFVESTLLSGLTRINYVLSDRFLFTVSGRADGSSRFGEGNKWGIFPSAAFSWILTEEEFIRQNFEQLSELKFRVSYGISGNQAISPYSSIQRYSPTSLSFGGTPSTGFLPANLGNPDLKWETTAEFNIGLEVAFWEDALRINTDYYVKNTSDLLALVNVPPTSGFNTTFQNIGSTRNRGIELDVDAALLRRDLTWNVGFNISANRNIVTETAGGQDIIAPIINILGSANIIREGEPLGAFYGFETDGLTEDGFFKFVDQNGDGEITNADRVILGSPYPDLVYGFTTHMSYGNFHFRASVQGEYGRDMWNSNRYRFMSSMHRGQVPVADVANKRWTPDNPNPNAPYPRATSVLNQQPSDWYIEDASYLRLQNVQLTYHLSHDIVQSLGMRSASFSLSGQNLITLTGYSWYTPDINTFGSGDLRIGVDHRSYPSARSVTFGVRIGL